MSAHSPYSKAKHERDIDSKDLDRRNILLGKNGCYKGGGGNIYKEQYRCIKYNNIAHTLFNKMEAFSNDSLLADTIRGAAEPPKDKAGICIRIANCVISP